VQSISGLIIESGRINIDFADVMTVMKDQGDALMAIGYGEGENRVEDVVSSVLDNPLLEDISIVGAKRALIYVAGSNDLPIVEYEDVVKRITTDMDQDAIIIPGMYLDPSLGDKIRVTVIATGFNDGKKVRMLEVVKHAKNEIISNQEFDAFIGNVPTMDYLPPREKRDELKYAKEDLDVPTVIRDRRFFTIPDNTLAKAQSN
jgi:cell division protein FtsZ